MEKTNINTALAIFFVATAVMVIGGLAAMSLTTTTAMAAKPSFGYCAQGSQLKVCGTTIEDCERGREIARIEGHCHPSPIRAD
jgi:hypothetical protein